MVHFSITTFAQTCQRQRNVTDKVTDRVTTEYQRRKIGAQDRTRRRRLELCRRPGFMQATQAAKGSPSDPSWCELCDCRAPRAVKACVRTGIAWPCVALCLSSSWGCGSRLWSISDGGRLRELNEDGEVRRTQRFIIFGESGLLH